MCPPHSRLGPATGYGRGSRPMRRGKGPESSFREPGACWTAHRGSRLAFLPADNAGPPSGALIDHSPSVHRNQCGEPLTWWGKAKRKMSDAHPCTATCGGAMGKNPDPFSRGRGSYSRQPKSDRPSPAAGKNGTIVPALERTKGLSPPRVCPCPQVRNAPESTWSSRSRKALSRWEAHKPTTQNVR